MNLGLVLILALAQTQDPEVTLSVSLWPDTVSVGDPLSLTVVVEGLDGAGVDFPTLPDTGDVTALDPPLVRGDEPSTRTAVYRLAAWKTGELRTPDAQVVLRRDGVENTIQLPGVSFYVRSVLPEGADPDTLSYQPALGVLGPNWSLAEKLAGGALALALILAVGFYLRKRARAAQTIVAPPPRPPRERALEALDRLADSGLIDGGEYKAFYSKLAQILREFIALEHAPWGVDLTSSELLAAARLEDFNHLQLEALRQLLNEADLVKFARRSTPRGRAGQDLEATRRWIRDFQPPAPPPPPESTAEIAPPSEATDGGLEEEPEADGVVQEIESIFENGGPEDGEDPAVDEGGGEVEEEPPTR